MKLSPFIVECSLHFRMLRVVINAAAWVMFPKHRAHYWHGIRHEFSRSPPSRLGILLAASHDRRKLPQP